MRRGRARVLVALRGAPHGGGPPAAYAASKPHQNADIERFNRSFRTEVLDAWIFTSLAEVRAVVEEWRLLYNKERAQESLGHVPPLTFLPRPPHPTESQFRLSA